MLTRRNILIIAAVITLIVGAALLVGNNSKQKAATQEPEQVSRSLDAAPEFTLENYNGITISSSDIDAPITVINFWASWCPFCTEELPDFATLQKEFPEKVKVIAINRGESKKAAKAFTDKVGITDDLTFLLNPSESYYQKVGGFAMPETLFLDNKGNIFRHHRGPLSPEKMREVVQEWLSVIGKQNTASASSSLGCSDGQCRIYNSHRHGN